MRVLVSAFEPFGGRPVNSSWELASRLPGRAGRHAVAVARLPVVYGAAWDALSRAVGGFRPDAVVALGECPGRAFRLERVAVNLRSGGKDNAGRTADAPLDPAGRASYLSALPLERMRTALSRARIPVEPSLSAGAYLCNEVFYFLMRAHAARPFPGGAGFIHVPRGAEMRWPRALESAVAAI